MSPFIDFSWQAERPLPTSEAERWEAIIREAMGGPGWVVMRQVHGIWYVEEAQLADVGAEKEEQADRRLAVRDALRLRGKAVETR